MSIQGWIVFMIGAATTSPAFALPPSMGGVDGGGGKSVVCRDSAGKILSAEVLDLYEGRVQYGLKYTPSGKKPQDLAKEVGAALASGRSDSFSTALLHAIDFVHLGKVLLPEGARLTPVDDSHHVILPRNCQVEQLAHYTERNQILVDQEIWNALPDDHQSALLVHEALYLMSRPYGAKNSIRVRKAVAFGFFGYRPEPVLSGLPEKRWECHSVRKPGASAIGTHFYAYNDESGMLTFQFDYINGAVMLDKSVVRLDRIPVSALNGGMAEETYWIFMEGGLENLTPVTLEFLISQNGQREMRLSFISRPEVPGDLFTCAESK